MNTRVVAHLLCFLLAILGLAMIACGLFGYLIKDTPAAWQALAGTGVATLIGALTVIRLTRGEIDLSRKDGFAVVTFTWVACALVGAIPFVASGVIPSYVAAVFESVSGFTTTGASVITELEPVPKSILLWRALTHFFGGMGVLVLCLAVLPFIGVSGTQIFRAEATGPSKDRLTPRIAGTAKLLWGIYCGLNVVETILLRLGGMSWFDAVCHSMATIATGGFSTRTASIAAFNSLYIEMVVIVFMFIAAINFALFYQALTGRLRAFWRDTEFRTYIAIWFTICMLASLNLWAEQGVALPTAFRNAFFSCTSTLSTTGFATVNFDLWPSFAKTLIVLTILMGGCAGSTAGAIKISRVWMAFAAIIQNLRQVCQPRGMFAVKMNERPVEPQEIQSALIYILAYLMIAGLATVIMCLFTPDLISAFTSVIACLGGVGPGLGSVGPISNYAAVHPAGQIVLTICMLLGRLELFTILILLTPTFWKK